MSILVENNPTPVGSGTRFIHYLVDGIVFYFLVLFPISFSLNVLSIEIDSESETIAIYLVAFIIINSYYLTYSLFEYFFQKTPAKFLTKTIVVNSQGTKPSFLRILVRNYSRLIPFNSISFLFSNRGIHDRVSGTYVARGD